MRTCLSRRSALILTGGEPWWRAFRTRFPTTRSIATGSTSASSSGETSTSISAGRSTATAWTISSILSRSLIRLGAISTVAARELTGPGAKGDHEAEDRRCRRPKLVRRQCDEVPLNLCDPSELVVEGRTVDAEGDSLRYHLEQLDVLRGERPRAESADVDDPEHPFVGDQRDPEQGLDAFLAQDRVQHLCVVHVGDHDRRPLRRDAAGEALPDGDPHALLDLLLESFRGPGDELSTRLVEQEDGARVCLEGIADTTQQLVEQLVE